MTFDPTIPGATDIISQSQGQILINFQQTNTLFSTDHVTFDASATLDRGKHKKSTYVEQPDPVNAANEISLYCKEKATVSTLFLRKEGAAGTIIQMSAQDPTIASSGSTFLPGGIILKWGDTGVVGDHSPVNFASAFPTACWGVTLTISDPNATTKTINVKSGTLSTTQFAVRVSTGNISAFYFAIGN